MAVGSSSTHLGSSPVPPMDTRRFAPGTLVAERYRIVALAGRGGMGEVYRADDQRVGQTVALKFLPVALEHDELARERLIAEVRNARAISHPNICRVYDIAETRGRYFLTMEYIDGEDLASLLRRIGRLPAPKALEIARQMCAGLSAAHDRGVLHRDLKPANVMIDGRGQARITDFGLAVEAGPLTSPSDTSGTASYMAPERFEGKPATVQSDLYALGLILYETYTGKPAFTGATVRDLQRAHTDSTPTNPSALVSDIEPAVERAILRCLEKIPTKRPASAAQVAMALPGGDPLAAALAAGETPSPELVAASGEEGTLPRAKAWLWFASCLAALVLAVPLGSAWHLANLMPARDPVLLQESARRILNDIGFSQRPADSAWWFLTDPSYMSSLLNDVPARSRFDPPTTPSRSAVLFCYRQSPDSLFAWSPIGDVDSTHPPPLSVDDAMVVLNSDGGLRYFRAGGLSVFAEFRPTRVGELPWRRLFEAAALNLDAFRPVAPKWTPVFAFDTHVAWEGRGAGEDLRVEAAAYRGRPVDFRVYPAADEPRLSSASEVSGPRRMADTIVVLTFFGGLAVVGGVLARRNFRMGRGDRKGALRIAVAAFLIEAVVLVLNRHWTLEPIYVLIVPTYLFGVAFWVAGTMGASYLGLEPYVRRQWPHLLIAWTRLLEGRWRDPLVGRSLLVGTIVALFTMAILPGLAAIATRTLGLPVSSPLSQSLGPATTAVAGLLAMPRTGLPGVLAALCYLVILLVARLIVRNDRAAWGMLFVMCAGGTYWIWLLTQPWLSAAPLGTWVVSVVTAAALVSVLAKHGLLACAVACTVGIALWDTPLTYDLDRWYAWRTLLLVALITALAAWGFRNVLGRQTAFPGGEPGE